jgi:hypothetical protein
MTLITVALLFALALLLWAFAVLLWDFLEDRTRGWLRVLLVVVLAPSCALAAALATVMITSALLTALEPHERPAGTPEPPRHNEPAEPQTTSGTSERTGPETTIDGMGTPSPSATSSATPSPSAAPSP